MFCKNCGQTIDDNAVVCPHCGVQVAQVKSNGDGNGMAVAGFVLFFFGVSFIGLILSIVGYKRAKNGADHRGLAIAGIVLNSVELVGIVIGLIACIATCGAFASAVTSAAAVCAVL